MGWHDREGMGDTISDLRTGIAAVQTGSKPIQALGPYGAIIGGALDVGAGLFLDNTKGPTQTQRESGRVMGPSSEPMPEGRAGRQFKHDLVKKAEAVTERAASEFKQATGVSVTGNTLLYALLGIGGAVAAYSLLGRK